LLKTSADKMPGMDEAKILILTYCYNWYIIGAPDAFGLFK
jgi:hypothetical protein